ncbi:MAG TPA: AsnC family transcriptional regulator [Candidatus Nitrosotalea sp.]|nr:AsnC family transcriptional regulator [Candidatus Nitrosotalea sp.]
MIDNSMPLELDDIDVAILNSLFNGGRKSFRQIAREIKVSTPTVMARYERLVSSGLIKSISPIIDTSRIDKKAVGKINPKMLETKPQKIDLKKQMQLKISCEYCKGPIGSKPHIIKFANIQRFFCCTSCKSLYHEKYSGRIKSLSKRSEKNTESDF